MMKEPLSNLSNPLKPLELLQIQSTYVKSENLCSDRTFGNSAFRVQMVIRFLYIHVANKNSDRTKSNCGLWAVYLRVLPRLDPRKVTFQRDWARTQRTQTCPTICPWYSWRLHERIHSWFVRLLVLSSNSDSNRAETQSFPPYSHCGCLSTIWGTLYESSSTLSLLPLRILSRSVDTLLEWSLHT